MTLTSDWKRLGDPAPASLAPARLALHRAAQAVAAVGASLLEPRPDDSHPNLGWSEPLGALLGHPVPGGLAAALRLAEPAWLLVDAAGAELAALPLEGRTVEEGRAFLERALAERRGREQALRLPGYELPEHPAAGGAPFEPGLGAAAAELGRWYANASHALEAVAAAHPTASPVRCWPHHFDLATLIALDEGGDPETARSVGLGLSPGDGSYPEPYLYVTPWPYPAADALPALSAGAGHWHTEGFTAAILPADALVAAGDAPAQASRLHAFLDAALAASKKVLGA